ncbi:MAG: phosphatase PAP2 family protein [Bacteroidota bacterium]
MLDGLIQWDKDLLVYLNSLGSPKYDSFWLIITRIDVWIPLFLLFGFLIFRKALRKTAWLQLSFVLVFALFITLLSKGVKILTYRLRPCNDPDINRFMRILDTPRDFSFFSGHASSSFGITMLMMLFLKDRYKWVAAFLVWPFLFAYSRLYLGVHFPLDVLIGGLVGVASALLFYRYYQSLKVRETTSGHPE